MAKGKYQEWLAPEGLLKLEGWARDGLTDEDIAIKIGVNRTTLYAWMKKYPDISDALKRGKEVIDRQVENALLKRALGYEYTEDEYAMYEMDEDEYFNALEDHMMVFKMAHPEAGDEDIDRERMAFPRVRQQLVKRKTKEVVPDTTAQIFWLKNRKPEVWRDKRETELSGNVGVINPYASLTEDELRKLAARDG